MAPGTPHPKMKLAPDAEARVRKVWATELLTIGEISQRFGIGYAAIHRVCAGLKRPEGAPTFGTPSRPRVRLNALVKRWRSHG